MCFAALFGSQSAPPPAIVAPPPPTAPTPDADAIRQRELREAELLAARGGSFGTVKTDLAPSGLQGQRRVLLGV